MSRSPSAPFFPQSSSQALPTVTNNTFFLVFPSFFFEIYFDADEMQTVVVVLANYSTSIRKKIDSTRSFHPNRGRRIARADLTIVELTNSNER